MVDAEDCRIPNTHDKFVEAHYFLHAMMREYHEPDEFRWNLNAFLQALKSIEGIANVELQATSGFRAWWPAAKKELREDPLLFRFSKGRDIVVHRAVLLTKSKVEGGIFRGNKLRLAIQYELSPSIPSDVILQQVVKSWTGKMIDSAHSAIGEQLGVRRTWIAPVLDQDEEVLAVAHRAWARMSEFVRDAYQLVHSELPEIPDEPGSHDAKRVNLLTESDIDPELPEKWGWED